MLRKIEIVKMAETCSSNEVTINLKLNLTRKREVVGVIVLMSMKVEENNLKRDGGTHRTNLTDEIRVFDASGNDEMMRR